ncbi:MAG TPA: hypothetical protein VF518_03965, partial [Polyangia bacterium]
MTGPRWGAVAGPGALGVDGGGRGAAVATDVAAFAGVATLGVGATGSAAAFADWFHRSGTTIATIRKSDSADRAWTGLTLRQKETLGTAPISSVPVERAK